MNTASLKSATVGEIRVPQIEEQIMALQVNSDDLRKMVSVIETSLGSVISPLPEQPPRVATPAPVLVPLATMLQDICSQFRASVDHLREINARIELPTRGT